MQSAVLAYLQCPPVKIRRPYGFAKTMITREVIRFYKKQTRYYRKHGVLHERAGTQQMSLHDLPDIIPVVEEDQLELLHVEDYFTKLEQTHGPKARAVAEKLYEDQENARKALHLSPSEWNRILGEVREFTRSWLAGT